MNITKKQIAVVIPYFHDDLSLTEEISLKQCERILGAYSIVLLIPERLQNKIETKHLIEVVPDCWLESIASYNDMMVNSAFYARFVQYEYILIYQLDAFVFSDRLLEFCNLGYDYIGAPWLRRYREIRNFERKYFDVGNGGFSLRNVRTFLAICCIEYIEHIEIPEDAYWAKHISSFFKIPPVKIALDFAFEEQVQKSFELNDRKLSFGCHAWYKFDLTFLKNYIQKFGYDLEKIEDGKLDLQCGYRKNYLDATEYDIRCVCGVSNTNPLNIVVFGAGVLGKRAAIYLRIIGIENVYCIDNNPERVGAYLGDIVIESPKEILLSDLKNKVIIVAMGKNYIDECKVQLEDYGLIYRKDFFLYHEFIDSISKKLGQESF